MPCARERKPGPPQKTASDKVAALVAVHKGRYDYSLVPSSFLAADAIPVVCPAHGLFTPKYYNHLSGSGCPKCAGQGLSREEWVARFRAIHGNNFNYSLLPAEIKARGRIDIICPAHGVFSQKATSHHEGAGCLKCRHTNKQIGAGGWGRSRWARVGTGRVCKLYCVRFDGNNEVFFKVGITSESLEKRFRRITKYAVSPLFCYESNNPHLIWDLEHTIKRMFKSMRYVPALPFAGCRECYSEIAQIISFVKSSTLRAPA
jgi:hypothetical protein